MCHKEPGTQWRSITGKHNPATASITRRHEEPLTNDAASQGTTYPVTQRHNRENRNPLLYIFESKLLVNQL